MCSSFLHEKEYKGSVGLVREVWREKKTNPRVVGVAQRAHSRRRAEQRGGVKAGRGCRVEDKEEGHLLTRPSRGGKLSIYLEVVRGGVHSPSTVTST